MKVDIETSWKEILKDEFEKDYFRNLFDFIESEYQTQTVYPPKEKVFSAFEFTPFNQVKVVLIGQDPYHGPNQANGLSFSVSDEVPHPPSLKNIFKEVNSDFKSNDSRSGNLENWAKQGVLLLNTTLTVRASQAGSHQKKGWEEFTDAVIQKLAHEKENLVFILWGSQAQKKGKMIDEDKHCVIKSVHPSPLSSYRGFFGSQPFSKTNSFLKSIGKEEIEW
jgi:uracil-DNA glycosylase